MRRREYYWSLFHASEKNQLDGLRTDQVEAIFAAIPKSQKREWHVWKEGFDAWKPFEDFPQLVISLRKADDQPVETPPPFPTSTQAAETMTNTSSLAGVPSGKPAAAAKPTASKPTTVQPISARAKAAVAKNPGAPTSKLVLEDEDEEELELSLVRSGVLEDRNNMRFDKIFEVRVFIGEDVYPNASVNISLKGMQLRDPLPKSLPRYFNVEIGKKGERAIPVVCSEVKSKDGSPSTRLKIESNEHASALLTMLLAGA